MLRCVALVRTDVSEECSAIIRVIRIGELETSATTSSSFTMTIEAIRSSETSVLTGVTRLNIPADGILQSHRRENIKSYII
jgi:hypothetical protein